MIRYVNDRFVDVELVVSEKTGLKIPNSAITKKQFYTVPKEYFTQGGDSSDPGLMIENHAGDTGSVTLVQPTIYYETDDFYYIDDETVSAGEEDAILVISLNPPAAMVFMVSLSSSIWWTRLTSEYAIMCGRWLMAAVE